MPDLAQMKLVSNLDEHPGLLCGGNIRLLIEKYDMNVKNVVKAGNERTNKNEELVRVSEQVKEVIWMRYRYIGSVMSRSECDDILTFLCTG